MNRQEIEKEIKESIKRLDAMQSDLKRFATELSAPSQIAIIARIVLIEQDIKQYESMLDILKFDEIIDGEFK